MLSRGGNPAKGWPAEKFPRHPAISKMGSLGIFGNDGLVEHEREL